MPAVVLQVDDSSDDVILAQAACASAQVAFELRSVDRGEKAIAYLQGLPPYADRKQFPLPKLILLDLKMPGLSGFEVLAWMRSHAEPVRTLPVIIFTSSVHAEDRLHATALGANEFWVKPVDFETLQQLMGNIDRQLASDIRP